MLLQLSDRLPVEFPDLFALSLPTEARKEEKKEVVWCLVARVDHGD